MPAHVLGCHARDLRLLTSCSNNTSVRKTCCMSQLAIHRLTWLHTKPHTAFWAHVQHGEEVLNTQALLKLPKRPIHACAGKLFNILHTITDLALMKMANVICTAYSSPLADFVVDCYFVDVLGSCSPLYTLLTLCRGRLHSTCIEAWSSNWLYALSRSGQGVCRLSNSCQLLYAQVTTAVAIGPLESCLHCLEWCIGFPSQTSIPGTKAQDLLLLSVRMVLQPDTDLIGRNPYCWYARPSGSAFLLAMGFSRAAEKRCYSRYTTWWSKRRTWSAV